MAQPGRRPISASSGMLSDCYCGSPDDGGHNPRRGSGSSMGKGLHATDITALRQGRADPADPRRGYRARHPPGNRSSSRHAAAADNGSRPTPE